MDVLAITSIISSGVKSGFACNQRAIVPATIGVDIDVPDMAPQQYVLSLKEAFETTCTSYEGCSSKKELLYEDTILAPGARTSGFVRPSRVGPIDEKYARSPDLPQYDLLY